MSIKWDLFSRMGDYRQTALIPVAVFSTGEVIRAHSGGEATKSFCKGMKQPLADLQLLQPETKETASESTYGTPLKTPSMLEGDVPHEHMTKHI